MKNLRLFAAVYLVLQSLAAIAWWIALIFIPQTRGFFKPDAAPDVVLLAFALPDAILFIGAALWAAHRLVIQPRRALMPLALHTGAAVYAALYCLAQWLLSGEAGFAALCMAPCLIVQPFLLWKLRSEL